MDLMERQLAQYYPDTQIRPSTAADFKKACGHFYDKLDEMKVKLLPIAKG